MLKKQILAVLTALLANQAKGGSLLSIMLVLMMGVVSLISTESLYLEFDLLLIAGG